MDVARIYPLAGAGLTGEPFIEREVVNIYIRSPDYSARWEVVTPATELLINYFWLHWIYLGGFWGLILVGAVTAWAARSGYPEPRLLLGGLGDPGPVLGAYVGPKCWLCCSSPPQPRCCSNAPD